MARWVFYNIAQLPFFNAKLFYVIPYLNNIYVVENWAFLSRAGQTQSKTSPEKTPQISYTSPRNGKMPPLN